MIRFTLLHLLFVSLPFVMYFAYRAIVNQRRKAAGEEIDEVPIQLLFLAASLISLVILVVGVILETQGREFDENKVYVPPELINGEVVPGRFVTAEEAAQIEAERAARRREPPPSQIQRQTDPVRSSTTATLPPPAPLPRREPPVEAAPPAPEPAPPAPETAPEPEPEPPAPPEPAAPDPGRR